MSSYLLLIVFDFSTTYNDCTLCIGVWTNKQFNAIQKKTQTKFFYGILLNKIIE